MITLVLTSLLRPHYFILPAIFATLILPNYCTSVKNSNLNINRQANISLLKKLAKHEAENSSTSNFCSKKRKRSERNDFNDSLKTGPLYRIPSFILLEISSYLDFKSVKNLENSSKYFLEFFKNFFASQLSSFSPIFVFDEHEMNRIMHSFLNTNFFSHGIKTLSSSNFIDELGMTCIRIDENRWKNGFEEILTPEMTYLILSFIFEVTFGPNEIIPTFYLQLKNILIQKIVKYNMPKCIEWYKETIKRDLKKLRISKRIKTTAFKKVNEFLDIFAGGRILETSELMEFYNSIFLHDFEESDVEAGREFGFEDEDDDVDEIVNDFDDDYIDYLKSYVPEVKTALLKKMEKLIYEGHNQNLPNYKDNFFEITINDEFSQLLFDLFPLEDLLSLKNDSYEYEIPNNLKVLKALFEKLPIDENDPRQYLWTRDPILKPFDSNIFSTLGLKTDRIDSFMEMIDTESLNIYQIEMVYQILGIFDLNLGNLNLSDPFFLVSNEEEEDEEGEEDDDEEEQEEEEEEDEHDDEEHDDDEEDEIEESGEEENDNARDDSDPDSDNDSTSVNTAETEPNFDSFALNLDSF